MSKKVVIIGSGNVAEALALSFRFTAYRIVQIFARNKERGGALAEQTGSSYESRPEKLAPADIYIISVADKAIREVSESLAFKDAVVVHTSASSGMDELSPRIKNRGILYPLQTFTAGRKTAFENIPFFIEASDPSTYASIEELASSLSALVYPSDAAMRRNLHVAAVFVCNFVNHMYVIGEGLMKEHNLDFGVLKPLIAETAQKVLENSSPTALQTGPAVREDSSTLERHLSLLADHPDLQQLYRAITDHIIKSKTDGKL